MNSEPAHDLTYDKMTIPWNPATEPVAVKGIPLTCWEANGQWQGWVVDADVMANGQIVRIEVHADHALGDAPGLGRRMLQAINLDDISRRVRREAAMPYKRTGWKKFDDQVGRLRAAAETEGRKRRRERSASDVLELARLCRRCEELDLDNSKGSKRRQLAEEFHISPGAVSNRLNGAAVEEGLWVPPPHGRRTGGRMTDKAKAILASEEE